eukprot:gene1658-33051_t
MSSLSNANAPAVQTGALGEREVESTPAVDGPDAVAVGYPVETISGNYGAIVPADGFGQEEDGWQRPSDFDIVKHENNLRAEVAETLPYVAEREPLEGLNAEYEHGNEVFLYKITKLQQTFTHFRRTRGDGNCFFRAFLFSYIEGLLNSQDMDECNR